MKTSSQVVGAATMAALFLMGSAWAQNAPGEDPVILTKRIAVQMAPIGGARPSSPMESMTSLPAWMKAKVARYEAKANSDQTNGISTDADAVRVQENLHPGSWQHDDGEFCDRCPAERFFQQPADRGAQGRSREHLQLAVAFAAGQTRRVFRPSSQKIFIPVVVRRTT
jgi:hypothetical protein